MVENNQPSRSPLTSLLRCNESRSSRKKSSMMDACSLFKALHGHESRQASLTVLPNLMLDVPFLENLNQSIPCGLNVAIYWGARQLIPLARNGRQSGINCRAKLIAKGYQLSWLYHIQEQARKCCFTNIPLNTLTSLGSYRSRSLLCGYCDPLI